MPSLRTTLLVDSVVCFIYGAVLTVASDPLSSLFAIDTVSVLGYSLEEALRILGLSVLGIGLYVCIVGCIKRIVPLAVWFVIAIEIAWIVGSLLLLVWFGNVLSWIGITFLIAGIIAVSSFMIFELIGLQFLLRSRADATQGSLN